MDNDHCSTCQALTPTRLEASPVVGCTKHETCTVKVTNRRCVKCGLTKSTDAEHSQMVAHTPKPDRVLFEAEGAPDSE